MFDEYGPLANIQPFYDEQKRSTEDEAVASEGRCYRIPNGAEESFREKVPLGDRTREFLLDSGMPLPVP